MTDFSDPVLRSLWLIRDDAEARGMMDVVVALGWGIIRRQHEELVQKCADIFGRAMKREPKA